MNEDKNEAEVSKISPKESRTKITLSDLKKIHTKSRQTAYEFLKDAPLDPTVVGNIVHERRRLAKNISKQEVESLREYREIENELIEQGERDPLTNAYNRRGLQSELVKELARLQRIRKQNEISPSGLKAKSSILYIDVNNLKFVNDSFGGGKRGHAAGDRLLQRVVLVLQEASRAGDIVARVGGDEFVVILAGADVDDALKFVEERIKPKNINVSIGIAPLNEKNPWKSLERADKEMYKGKRAYRQSDKNVPMVAGRRLSG